MSDLFIAEVIVPIAVASITAGLPALISVRRLHKDNNDQHESTATALQHVQESIDRVETKIDTHIGEHAGADKAVAASVTNLEDRRSNA